MDNPTNSRHSRVVPPRSARAFSLGLVVAVVATIGKTSAERAVDPKSVSPVVGATGVCPDTPLRITFAAPPALGSAGKIRIVDAADDGAVETIDVSLPTASKTIGGLSDFKYYPVIVSGAAAVIYPRNGALAYNKTYYVTVDAGVFQDAAGHAIDVAPRKAWRFTTKAPPPAGKAKLTVAADGAGDFCTVQAALDFIPEGNTSPTTIFVRKGTYPEIVFFTNKHAITLLGEDRKESVITYANNDRFNHSAGNPYAVAGANPSDAVISRGDAIYRRAVFMAHRANDLVIANLTIRNTTPTGGSQAETVILNGTANARAILKDLNLASTQDTLQINGQAYVTNSTIEGDVDFLWGQGPSFFDRCTCRSLRSNAPYSQIRNPAKNHGFVFDHCTFDGLPGVEGNYLSRIKPERFPDSELVLLDSALGSSVSPVLWQIQDAPNGPDGGAANLHFWELNSHDLAGKPADVSKRLAVSRQLKMSEDAALIANYRNPTYVLGNGWNPRTAPIFTAQANVTGR